MMKRSIKYKVILSLTLLSFMFNSIKAEVQEKTKTFTQELVVDETTEIELEHLRGDLNVFSTDKKKAYIEVELKVRGTNEDDLQIILNNFSIDVDQSDLNYAVYTNSHIKSWVETHNWFGDKFKIKFDNGDEISHKIELIDIVCKVYIPKIKKISLSNKYDNITWDDIDCDVEAVIYSGEIQGNSINHNLKIESKYSKIFIGDIIDGDFDIYDSSIKMGNTRNLLLRDKYSKIDLKKSESLTLYLHDSDVEANSVKNKLFIEAKYSDLEIDACSSASIDLHDCDIRLPKCGSLKIDSKYSTFNLGEISDIEMNSHDDNVKIDKLCGLDLVDTKYSEYDIDEFSGYLDVKASHDDDFNFTKIGDFEGMDFISKYSYIRFPIEKTGVYELKVNLTYGSININREIYELSKEIDKDSKIEFTGKTNGSNHKSVNITAYDSKIRLN